MSVESYHVPFHSLHTWSFAIYSRSPDISYSSASQASFPISLVLRLLLFTRIFANCTVPCLSSYFFVTLCEVGKGMERKGIKGSAARAATTRQTSSTNWLEVIVRRSSSDWDA
jgi:hypothetical protein